MTLCVNSQTTMKIEPFSINAGETKTVTLNMDNDGLEAASFVCDIYLPEGLEIEKNSRGMYNLSFNTDSGRTKNGFHSLAPTLQKDGAVRIMCYAPSAYSFLGKSGAIVNIPIVASETLTSGVAELKIANQEITNPSGAVSVRPATFTSSVKMGSITDVKSVSATEGEEADGKYLKNGIVVIKKDNKEYYSSGSVKK